FTLQGETSRPEVDLEKRRAPMRTARTTTAILLLLAAAAAPAAWDPAGQKRAKPPARGPVLPRSELSERDAILHVLDRLAFGPRPGDVERVRNEGLARYIEEQLHPEGKPDPEVASRLESLGSLGLAAWELLGRYPDAALQKQIAERRKDMAA